MIDSLSPSGAVGLATLDGDLMANWISGCRLKKYHLPLTPEMLMRMHQAKEGKLQVEHIKACAQEEAKQRRDKRRILQIKTCDKHLRVSSIMSQIHDCDNLDQGLRPLIVATFGENRLECQTLVDTGADVNAMPYSIFKSIPNLVLIPTKGVLTSFVNDPVNYIGYTDVEVMIRNIPCPHRFYIMDAHFDLETMTLGQPWQRKYQAYPEWSTDRVYFTVNGRVTYQNFLKEDELLQVPTAGMYAPTNASSTTPLKERESPPVQSSPVTSSQVESSKFVAGSLKEVEIILPSTTVPVQSPVLSAMA